MDELLPKIPHNAIICGKTRSGKTYHVLNIIEKYYQNIFNCIFIICPTFENNKTYNRPWLDKVKVFNGDVVDNLDCLIKMHSKGGTLYGKNSLIIIDDCSSDKDMNKHRTSISKIAFSGRHSNLTTWFISQRYVSVPKDFRDNIDWVLVTKCSDKRSFELLMNENDIILDADKVVIKQGLINTIMLLINTDIGKYIILNK